MAIKKVIQEAIESGCKISTTLKGTFDFTVDDFVDWEDWSRCANCRVYLHDSELNPTDSGFECRFCKDDMLEEMPDIEEYGMNPHELMNHRQYKEDMEAWNDSRG